MIIWKYRSRIWLAQPIRNTIRNWSNDCNCLWANSKRGETVCKWGKTRGENNHAYSNFIRQIVSHVFLPVRSAKNQEELSQSFHAYLYQFFAMPQHAILMNCHEICILRNENWNEGLDKMVWYTIEQKYLYTQTIFKHFGVKW